MQKLDSPDDTLKGRPSFEKVLVENDLNETPSAPTSPRKSNGIAFNGVHLRDKSATLNRRQKLKKRRSVINGHFFDLDVSSADRNFNLLAPRRFCRYLKWMIFKLISRTDILVISCEIALRWISRDLNDEKSILVQIMAWCHQATSQYLNQHRPSSVIAIWCH